MRQCFTRTDAVAVCACGFVCADPLVYSGVVGACCPILARSCDSVPQSGFAEAQDEVIYGNGFHGAKVRLFRDCARKSVKNV